MKLPKPRKRGDAYRIEIMIDGKRLSATRDTMKECEAWASRKLLEAKAGQLPQADTRSPLTLGELMTIQYEAVRRGTKGSRHDMSMTKMLKRDYDWLTSMRVVDITPQHLTQYRNQRLAKVQPSTVKRDFSYLSPIFAYAVTDLFIIKHNPCHDVNKPTVDGDRTRRISDSEIKLILESCHFELGQTPTNTYQWLAWLLLWAVESAMRRGEIMAMAWGDIKGFYVHIPDSKIGASRDVPISPIMRELLDSVKPDKPNKKSVIVTAEVAGIKSAWQRTMERTMIQDLQFRDARHEAISRMVNTRKLPVEHLAKITGHKKIDTLVNTYYNPTADELYQALHGDK